MMMDLADRDHADFDRSSNPRHADLEAAFFEAPSWAGANPFDIGLSDQAFSVLG